MHHVPVLLDEVVKYLKPETGDRFIDGTAGDGGYIKEILRINPSAKILGIDLDQVSLDKLSMQLAQGNLSQRSELVQANFRDIKRIAQEKSFVPAAGVLLDLGFSSSQLDDPGRGLSFQTNGPLDMRFDPHQKLTARVVVNTYHKPDLVRIFKDYGEERLAAKIAEEIIICRKKQEITDTRELLAVIELALPKPVKYKVADYARRIFQAIRIEVNDELNSLKIALPNIFEILEPGGRMVIISFHSLEDRIVKEFFVNMARGCICPPDFPQCVCGKNPQAKILTRKPVTATVGEIENNPRSKPAKLRALKKA
ncbi:MAG: 16S rRNA (cytosine(1402)-N(4))-methyltransferase RsmH [Candidatus Doudnabacteria bacterium]|nr:16S rRNA (cytosine(1402)-N(4))-methyltransferase RsmH [Candidatus Doudnabacteria bacterium]